jgi:DNA repair protein RadB
MMPIGCRSLDVLLGGGLPEKVITQFYGPAGSGKTNVCLQALNTAARLGKNVVFVDTEGSLSEKRLGQMAGERLDRVLERTVLYEPSDFSQQADVIRKIEEIPAALIIVDSVTALYRLELSEEKAQETNRELGKQLSLLLSYSRARGIPVLVTNQVWSDFDTNSVEPVGGDVLKYSSKVIAELQKADEGGRVAILRKHLFRKEGETARFRIVERGLIEDGG